MTISLRRGLAVLTLLLGLAGPHAAAQSPDEAVLDEIVAVVGNEIILRSEVDGLAFSVAQQQGLEITDDLWMEALGELVNQHVLTIHAKRDTTLIVTDEQVDQTLDERIQQLTQQVGSEAALEERYGKSILQIKSDLREDYRDQLLAQRLRSEKLGEIRITPSETRRWFAQFPTDSLPVLPDVVRLAHIVRYPKVSEDARQEALDIVSAIRDSITTSGATIEEMARRFSDDPGSAGTGGRYTDFELNALVPEFAAMVARAPIGEITQPFETPFGYHILRVNERRGNTVDFNHVLIRVDQNQADPEEALAYLSTLRDSVVTHDVPFALLARRHSEEETSAEVGGRILDPNTGERDLFLDALGPSWRRTLDTLEVGQVSEPAEVELLDGTRAAHIVRLQRRIPSHRVDIETDYPRIEQLALQEKRARALQGWIQELREEVYVELRGKAEALSAVEGREGSLSSARN